MSEVIARALYRHLQHTINESAAGDPNHRLFFSLEGFDPETYKAFLDEANANTITGTRLQLRTIDPIQGHEELKLAKGHSATWYRNNLEPNQALILIFNRHTSDAQSLKDIHPITEGTLARNIEDLARTAISRQLTETDIQTLKDILMRMERVGIPTPQLRHLSMFFQEIDRHLEANPGDSLKEAAAWSLPQLGLFRAPTIAATLGTAKSDRPLKRNHDAALLGINPLEPRELTKYLERLKNSPLSVEEKQLLRRFLEEVLVNRRDLVDVYSIGWDKVDPIFYRKTRISGEEKRQRLGEELESSLSGSIKDDKLSELAVEALEALKAGRQPSDEALEALFDAANGLVSKTLQRRLNRERTITPQPTREFLSGLVKLCTDLVERFAETGQDLHLRVKFARLQVTTRVAREKQEEHRLAIEQEALQTFAVHYRGLEKAVPEIDFDLGKLWERLDDNAAYETPPEKVRKAELNFQVRILDGSNELSRSELIWNYDSSQTQALTTEHLYQEAMRVAKHASVPYYNSVGFTRDGTDLDLYDPFETLGTWYERASDLWSNLKEQLENRVPDMALNNARIAILHLAEAWQGFVTAAQRDGLLTTDIETLIQAYADTFSTADQIITTDVEANELCTALAKAWVVGEESFDTWAVVPFLHPLKLHWWLERTRRLNDFLKALKRSASEDLPIADVAVFKSSLESLLNSSGLPAVLALPDASRRSEYFLPVIEVGGYELFRPVRLAGLAFGLTDTLVNADESSDAAKIASRELQKVLQDYLETFPFTSDGLDVYLFNCRNGTLPGMLVNGLRKANDKDPSGPPRRACRARWCHHVRAGSGMARAAGRRGRTRVPS